MGFGYFDVRFCSEKKRKSNDDILTYIRVDQTLNVNNAQYEEMKLIYQNVMMCFLAPQVFRIYLNFLFLLNFQKQ